MKRLMILATCLCACGGPKTSARPAVEEADHASAAQPEPAPIEAAAPTEAAAPPEAAASPGAETKTAAEGAPMGDDVLARVLEMNSDKYGRPAKSFRKGHVSARKAPKVKKTKTGYEVQFASRAPITTPAVYDGRVYVSGGFRSKEYYAFEATSGKPTWAVSLDDDGPSSSACADRVCVFNTESCTVFALDAASGKMLWSWWLGDPLTSSPTIAGGRVFTSYPVRKVAGGKPRPPNATHALIAFDLHSGKVLWQQWLDSDVMSAPVATNGFVYVSTFSGTLLKLEQATGKFRYALQARATSAPVVQFAPSGRESMYYTRRGASEKGGAEEMIIRADDNSPKTRYQSNAKKAKYLDPKVQADSDYAAEGSANDAANGFSGDAPAAANPSAAYHNIGQGRVSTMQAFQGSRILHLGDRNMNTMGDEVVATSAEDGKKLWTYKLSGDVARYGGFLGTAPLAAGNDIVVATVEGDVIALDKKSGKERSKYKVKGTIRSQPVVAGGWIYVGTEDGRLVAIDTKNPSLTGWPMWGGNAARTGVRAAD